jgi:hypothetical protein
LPLAGYWFSLLFDTEDGGSTFLRNVDGLVPKYTASGIISSNFRSHRCENLKSSILVGFRIAGNAWENVNFISWFQNLVYSLYIRTVLALRRFPLRNFAHRNFYNEPYILGLACHPHATWLVWNSFRTKTKACRRKQKQTNVTSCSQLTLHCHLVCILYKIFYFLNIFALLIMADKR